MAAAAAAPAAVPESSPAEVRSQPQAVLEVAAEPVRTAEIPAQRGKRAPLPRRGPAASEAPLETMETVVPEVITLTTPPAVPVGAEREAQESSITLSSPTKAEIPERMVPPVR